VVGIEGTVAGRAYRHLDIQQVGTDHGGTRMWVPVLDGTERLGVLALDFPPGNDTDTDAVRALAGLAAELVVIKSAYGDLFERVRRRRPMSLTAELVWQLLPPLTFATDRLVISAALVPTYDLGGDSFDYGVDASTARFALFDAMGHGLHAGLLTTVALAGFRNARRSFLDLRATVDAIDAAIAAEFGASNFVTGILAELDLASGRLRWYVAGHPRPLLLRGGRIVKTLEGDPGLPLGLGTEEGSVAEEVLEAGDQLVLFTDGVTEARSAAGQFFGVERLADYITRASAAGAPAPETMRQLVHAILDHHGGKLDDDATTLFVEWRGHGSERLTR
jgi:serine phosphatase RsbU (regulator of sigma subunit)